MQIDSGLQNTAKDTMVLTSVSVLSQHDLFLCLSRKVEHA